ncbi:MAG TPA: tetratricopeptide repeat protein [Candidatus Angelobacter sp.]
MRKSAFIGSLFAIVLTSGVFSSLAGQQQHPLRSTQILLVLPFENASSAPGIDWIGESFPEVIGNRVSSAPLFIISRDDRLYAFDRMGIPAGAKPSRATIYEMAQQIDADYVVVGRYNFDGNTFSAQANVMDVQKLRLSPDLTESGRLTDLIKIQTALTWDILHALGLAETVSKNEFLAQFPPIRLDALENYIRGVLAGSQAERIKRFKEAIRLEPHHTLAMLQLGKTYYNGREYEQAMNWFSKIPAEDRNANEAQFFLGLAAYLSGQMDKAEAAFRFLSGRLPLTEVYNNLGVVAARRGEKQARSYFEKSIQTDPNDPDYRFNLAVEFAREGNAADAMRELRESLAIRSDPEAKSFLDSLNSGVPPAEKLPAQRIKRNYDESSFRQLAMEIENNTELKLQKTDPVTHAAFHAQRGQQLLEQGLLSEAEREFREAVILDPTNADAHSGLARVLESSQDGKGARNEARVAIRLKPTAEAYLVLARLDLAENNLAAAEQDVSHALIIDPANTAAASLKQDIATALSRKPQLQR